MPSVPAEPSDLQRQGRQRLIGAAALALVAAVVIPMVLDSDPRPASQAGSMAIPDRNAVAPLPPPDSSAAPKAAANAGAVPADPPAPASSAATPVPAAAPAAPSALTGFAVQVGAFRDETRLSQARQKLTSAGIRHYTERVPAAGGDLTRLRAGPFPDREAAAAAAAKMKAAGLDATVVSLP